LISRSGFAMFAANLLAVGDDEMNKRISWRTTGCWWLVLGVAWLAGQGAKPIEAPQITHDPVGVAPRGQPITVLAQISSAAPLKSVALHYTLSKDASPFKLAMQAAGPAIFTGTMSAALLGNAAEVSYYIEATDVRDAATETPWYRVQIKGVGDAPPAPVAITTPAPAIGAAGEGKGTAWGTTALIAGGAAAVVGAGIYFAGRNGGSDGGGSVTNVQGTYTGSKTITLTMPGQPASSATTPVTIIIDQGGNAYSDTLLDGQVISGALSGNSFSMSGSASASNLVSHFTFNGSVVDSRIVGTISGSAQSATNSGTYSGSFSAGK
jgi:hypothetical protein